MRRAIVKGGLLIDCAMAVLLWFQLADQSRAECASVAPLEFGGVQPAQVTSLQRPELHLTEPGEYCLSVDIYQQKLWDHYRRREAPARGGEALILIGADDVRVDLSGHNLSNDRASGYTLVNHYQYIPGELRSHWFARTHIRNGLLQSPGSLGIGLRLLAVRKYGVNGFGEVAAIPAGLSKNDVFIDTSHLIEDLTIHAGKHAILIDGRNNVIRNNRITVDAITAIVAQGPGVVIENNIIEVRNDLDEFSESARRSESRTPFAIRLIQADGAIVRNNQIRLLAKAGPSSLPAAIELVETSNATVEGNILGGFKAPVRADAASSYRDLGNSFETCSAGATRFLAPGDADQATRQVRIPSCR